MKLVHISDIHITGKYFRKDWGEKVIDMVNGVSPDVIAITGDITDFGHSYEYDIAEKYINSFRAKSTIVIPGNHDSRNGGYLIFEEMFGTRFPYFENEFVKILGVDSSEPDIDDGHIGRANYPLIRDKLKGDNRLKILLLHHHLIPIPGTGRERNIPVDAGDVLKLCQDIPINFVLSGHKHLAWIWKMENTFFITAGTATTTRLKGRSYPSFNILEIKNGVVILNECNVESGNKMAKEITSLSQRDKKSYERK